MEELIATALAMIKSSSGGAASNDDWKERETPK
jgi:hypothetical protein